MLSKFISIGIRLAIVAVIVGIAWFAGSWMEQNQPEPRRWDTPEPDIAVHATILQPQDYQVIVTSQGTVEERTRSRVLPQVSGRVEWISPRLFEGSFFETGDELVRIEKFDYTQELAVSKAALAQAQLRLAEEQARAEQAIQDWNRLGSNEEAPELVRRVPQLNDAQAAVNSAQARVELAQRNLDRTTITAPYAGVVLEKMVDVGQVVSPGSALADIFAIDYAEIRVPLPDSDLAFLDLPETYRGEQPANAPQGPKAIVSATVGGETHQWNAHVVRTESSFDIQSRMLKVVVQVDDPYGRTPSGRPPLKRGEYVTVDIVGKTLHDVYVIPRSAVRRGNEVLLINAENKIQRHTFDYLLRDNENYIVKGNFQPGQALSLTSIVVTNGTEVVPTIDGSLRLTEAQKTAREAAEKAALAQRNSAAGGAPGGAAGNYGSTNQSTPTDNTEYSDKTPNAEADAKPNNPAQQGRTNNQPESDS